MYLVTICSLYTYGNTLSSVTKFAANLNLKGHQFFFTHPVCSYSYVCAYAYVDAYVARFGGYLCFVYLVLIVMSINLNLKGLMFLPT